MEMFILVNGRMINDLVKVFIFITVVVKLGKVIVEVGRKT